MTNYILFSIMFLSFTSYVVWIWIALGKQQSISHSYLRLSVKQRPLFTFFLLGGSNSSYGIRGLNMDVFSRGRNGICWVGSKYIQGYNKKGACCSCNFYGCICPTIYIYSVPELAGIRGVVRCQRLIFLY